MEKQNTIKKKKKANCFEKIKKIHNKIGKKTFFFFQHFFNKFRIKNLLIMQKALKKLFQLI